MTRPKTTLKLLAAQELATEFYSWTIETVVDRELLYGLLAEAGYYWTGDEWRKRGSFNGRPEFILVGEGFDIESLARMEDTVWCDKCEDHLPTTNLCKHIWWDDRAGQWSTPDDRKRKGAKI